MRRARHWVITGLSVSLLSACAGGREPEPTRTEPSAASAPRALGERFSHTFPWGDAAAGFRRSAATAESLVQGPNAVAVLDASRILVLDRLAGRVAVVDGSAQLRTLSSVPLDVEDVVTGPGLFLSWSPVRASAELFDPQGKSLGALAIPRELRDVTGLAFGADRRVVAKTAYQEQITLGVPAAPVALAAGLAGKREGAYLLPNGRGVRVRARDGGAALEIVTQAADEQARSEVVKSWPLAGNISAARILGGSGTVACLRTETLADDGVLTVTRRALCMDVESGALVFDEPLPPPGLYVPRTEVAFGSGRLAWIHPTATGLTVESVRIAGTEVAQ